jgi:hypothetical protein
LIINEEKYYKTEATFERVCVSIPTIPFSQRIYQGESIFIGLNGLRSVSLDEFMDIDLIKSGNAYIISRANHGKAAAMISFAVIVINEEE